MLLVVTHSDMDMMDGDDEESYEGGSSKTGRINKGRWKKEEVCLAPILSSPAFLLVHCILRYSSGHPVSLDPAQN